MNYQAFVKQTQGDKTRVEATMNHVHILDLFSRSHHETPTKDVVLYISKLMKEIWETKLQQEFPSRRVTVTFLQDDFENLEDYQITFFQER